MLDYYDRCYDHELAGHAEVASVDLGESDPAEGAEQLLARGLVGRWR